MGGRGRARDDLGPAKGIALAATVCASLYAVLHLLARALGHV